jgi:hypothetical protein
MEDDSENKVNGLEQLRKQKEETIKRWSAIGLLEGLENLAKLFESKLSHVINESEDNKEDKKE